MSKDCKLLSDKHFSIASFAKRNKIDHLRFKASEHTADSEHHVQTVNNIATRLKIKINHVSRGVSTKYLQCYANWFQFVEANKNSDDIKSEANKILSENKTSWDVFTNIEILNKQSIKEYSKRTYRCPAKRQWRKQLRDTNFLSKLAYL